MKRISRLTPIAVVAIAALSVAGCLPYLYTEREPALLDGIDVDQTLDVAEAELAEPDAFSVLTVWAMRDQEVTAEQARRISRIYFDSIERVDDDDLRGRSFAVWHYTWAIANLYHFGDEDVRAELDEAYADSISRAARLDRSVAAKHVYGETVYTGLAHGGGRAYARKHLVVPGDEDFLQSFDEYLAEQRD